MNWNDVLKLADSNAQPPRRVDKTEAEWKNSLTEEEFYVTRKSGTEHPFTGEYCESHKPGLYGCKCCGTLLFDSSNKFDSGTGWPSFNEPVESTVIKYLRDGSFGGDRIEVQCNICDGHLGHVFPDGPPPTGLRYCINSASIKLAST